MWHHRHRIWVDDGGKWWDEFGRWRDDEGFWHDPEPPEEPEPIVVEGEPAPEVVVVPPPPQPPFFDQLLNHIIARTAENVVDAATDAVTGAQPLYSTGPHYHGGPKDSTPDR